MLPLPYIDYIHDLPKDIVKKNEILVVVESRKILRSKNLQLHKMD